MNEQQRDSGIISNCKQDPEVRIRNETPIACLFSALVACYIGGLPSTKKNVQNVRNGKRHVNFVCVIITCLPLNFGDTRDAHAKGPKNMQH